MGRVGAGLSEGLEFAAVAKRYRDGARGERFALRDASFALSKGERLIVRGASGAGKSTLVGLAAGLLLPTEGEVRIDGEAFSRLRETFRAEIRRRQMGVVLQGLALVPRMTALENVLLSAVPEGGIDRGSIGDARALFDRFGIGALAHASIETLSGGERQRVALCRALIRTPPILLLDEPSAHLDAEQVRTIAALLDEHRDRGGMPIVATHDPRLESALAGSRLIEVSEATVRPC